MKLPAPLTKAHIGVDSKTGLVHSMITTSANVHDSQVLPDLLHGDETRVWDDSAYIGQKRAIKERAPNAKDFTNRRARRNRPLTDDQRAVNRTMSRMRAKVEHPFCVVKRLWGFAKVRYRGLAKNTNRLFVAFALSNLFVSRNKLLFCTCNGRSVSRSAGYIPAGSAKARTWSFHWLARKHRIARPRTLGTLDGATSGGNGMNNLAWVSGISSLAGSSGQHATLRKRHAAIDLGTLGGANSGVEWPVKNDRGIVAGIQLCQLDANTQCW